MKAALGTVVVVGLALALVGIESGWGANAAEGPQRFVKGEGISEPRVKEKAAPVYPAEARKQHIEGTVVLDAVIKADGCVGPIEVVESAHELLSGAAVAAVREWKYEPARSADGRAVAVIFTITITFRLS